MKVETAIARIMARDTSDKAKWLALGNLALRQMPSSWNQNAAIAARDELKAKMDA